MKDIAKRQGCRLRWSREKGTRSHFRVWLLEKNSVDVAMPWLSDTQVKLVELYDAKKIAPMEFEARILRLDAIARCDKELLQQVETYLMTGRIPEIEDSVAG